MTRLLLLAALVTQSAAAQITISRADVAAFYTGVATVSSFSTDSSEATRGALQAVATRTGANQTWTLTGVAYSPDGTVTLTPVTGSQPGSTDPYFAPATSIVRIDTLGGTTGAAYIYTRLTDDALVTLGVVSSTPDGDIAVTFVPGLRQPLPFTFGTAWTAESQIRTGVVSPIPIEQSTREESVVVGWGTLVTPVGSDAALMVRTLHISRSRIVIPGIPPIESADSTLSLSFVTRGRRGASIALNPRTGRARDATYTTGTGAGTATGDGPSPSESLSLSVGPNPSPRGLITIRVSAQGPVDVAVYDALGREVAVLAHGTASGALTWDASAAAPGLYLVRAHADTASAVCHIVVAH